MIRRAVESDADAIQRILADSPQASQWLGVEVRTHCLQDILVWVACEDGDVMGVVAARQAADQGEILDVAVAAHRRRRGCGRSLVDFVAGQLLEAGVQTIFLEVRESNAGAQALYAQTGFLQVGRRRDYYRDPVEDGLVFSLSSR